MKIDLSLFVSTITLLITSSYYYKTIVFMERSNEVSLFNTLHTEYSKADMMEAYRTIEEFRVLHGHESLACAYAAERENHSPKGIELDHARRRILHWYQKVVYLHRFSLLHPDLLFEFPGRSRAAHFLKDVEPLALATCKIYGTQNCTVPFDYIRELFQFPPRKPIKCAEVPDDAKPSQHKGKGDDDKDEL